MKLICCLIAAFQLISCTNTFAQNKADSVIFLPLKMPIPEGAKKLGAIKAGNNVVATNCDYQALVADAKEKARAMGGNIVKITQLIAPAFISKCYKIEADVYYVDKLPAYSVVAEKSDETSQPGDNDYALLCIYRLADTTAFATSYHVHLDNDSVICTVKSKSRDSVKLYKDGPVTLWAKTEARRELKLDVKIGETYYVRCGLTSGEIRMVPVLELVDKKSGAEQFGKNNKKNKDKNKNVKYLQQIH